MTIAIEVKLATLTTVQACAAAIEAISTDSANLGRKGRVDEYSGLYTFLTLPALKKIGKIKEKMWKLEDKAGI